MAKNKRKKSRSFYHGLKLIDYEGGEYSANPSDYFMMSDEQEFKNNALAVTEVKNGWSRMKIIKHSPRKKDLILWNRKLKEFL